MLITARRKFTLAGAAAVALLVATALTRADDVTLSALSDVELLDAGIFDVAGTPAHARIETFEFLRRPDGGITLLSRTTMADGAARVQARYDYDADWKALRAAGRGLYEEEAVQVRLEAEAGAMAIRVRGEETRIDASVPCPDGCFMDMSPSGSPMFVMTRNYDHDAGGSQSFRWAAQALRSTFTSPENQRAALRLRRELAVERDDGSTITIRDYEMIERIPTPDGGLFVMEFDLWTDDRDRPMGYRINSTGGKPSTSGVVAFRRDYEEVRDAVVN